MAKTKKVHNGKPRIRLARLKVKNYKAIDELDLEFPRPAMPGDPDIFVMGSRNGVGKTSILESCSLLFLSLVLEDRWLEFSPSEAGFSLNLKDFCVRGGSKEASIEGDMEFFSGQTDQTYKVRAEIDQAGKLRVIKPDPALRKLFRSHHPHGWDYRYVLLQSLLGLIGEPLLLSPFIYLHSYRKIQAGSPTFGTLVHDGHGASVRRSNRSSRGEETIFSSFKMEILRCMMGEAKLIAGFESEGGGETLKLLNELILQYAGGTLANSLDIHDDAMSIRVNPSDGAPSFTLDGLSSGQKEIISTFFMVWRHTRGQAGI
ncbi:hypothetical protein HY256_05680, partial [Candidatus Sumerlaeota bacterium]|nr:hypothetical protein [Candidatus Sumerlaeota bacterium]